MNNRQNQIYILQVKKKQLKFEEKRGGHVLQMHIIVEGFFYWKKKLTQIVQVFFSFILDTRVALVCVLWYLSGDEMTTEVWSE